MISRRASRRTHSSFHSRPSYHHPARTRTFVVRRQCAAAPHDVDSEFHSAVACDDYASRRYTARTCRAQDAHSSITAVDTEANLAVVAYNKAALLIDYSLCLSEEAIQDRQGGDSATHRFTASYSAQHRTALPTLKSKVMIIGDLVSREGESAEEVVADHGALPGVILQATLFKECLDLDLQVWEQAARVESRAVWDEYEKRRQR